MHKVPYIFNKLTQGKKCVAILIDPEKTTLNDEFIVFIKKVNQVKPSYIFVGGSTVSHKKMKVTINEIKANSTLPIIVFPGNQEQFCIEADGLLFMSLISGRNPEFLIEQQIKSARAVFESGVVSLSTGYMLIDGGSSTSVERVSSTKPIPQSSIDLVEETAMAALLLGMQCIYLDAGSGAKEPVSTEIISRVSRLNVPLIVGGGIRHIDQIKMAHEAGASLVVIGNKIEEDPSFINELETYLQCETFI